MRKLLAIILLISSPAFADCDMTQPHKYVDTACINLTQAEIDANASAASAAQSAQAITNMQNQAKVALADSDKTMMRIEEGVSLGISAWTNADVVAWVNYRRALRALITSTTVQSIPTQPPFPAGT